MELTKEEVAQMIKEAIEKDRHERLEDSVNQIVDTADIDSPGYNVSRLFSQERSTYKQKISELFHKEGYETVGPKGEELNFNEYRILDIVRVVRRCTSHDEQWVEVKGTDQSRLWIQ